MPDWDQISKPIPEWISWLCLNSVPVLHFTSAAKEKPSSWEITCDLAALRSPCNDMQMQTEEVFPDHGHLHRGPGGSARFDVRGLARHALTWSWNSAQAPISPTYCRDLCTCSHRQPTWLRIHRVQLHEDREDLIPSPEPKLYLCVIMRIDLQFHVVDTQFVWLWDSTDSRGTRRHNRKCWQREGGGGVDILSGSIGCSPSAGGW